MKRALFAVFVLVLAAVGVMYSEIGLAEVVKAVVLVGWGIVLVVAIRFAVMFLLAYGWWLVIPDGQRPGFHDCVNLRLVRDAVNSLLPVAQVGGDIVAARLLARRGTSTAMAAAGVVTDVFIQVATQFAFTVAGLLLLLWHGRGATVATVVSSGLLLALPLLVGFVMIQRQGIGTLAQAGLRRLAGGQEWSVFAATGAFYEKLGEVHAARANLWRGAGVHVLAWCVGSIEVYVTLQFMGYPVGIAEAVVIESLGQAVRGAAFAVPGAVGVQEGGFVLLCAIYGVPAEPALAMSLVKRIADLAVGFPGLWVWHRLEGQTMTGTGATTATTGSLTRDTEM